MHLVADDDRATRIPAHLETAVMRAWDIRAGSRRYRLDARRVGVAAFAAAACAVLAAALWVQRAADNGSATGPAPAALGETAFNDLADYSLGSIATTGVLLEEDRASLQLVRLSVQPSVLVAFGYPLANPTETEPVDVEVLIGLDGVPRAIRPVDNNGTWSTR
jgi:hypothetical protein